LTGPPAAGRASSAAVSYYGAYRDEIDELIADNERVKRTPPFRPGRQRSRGIPARRRSRQRGRVALTDEPRGEPRHDYPPHLRVRDGRTTTREQGSRPDVLTKGHPMLVVSPAAAAAIDVLLSSSGLPDGAALRLARGQGDGSLHSTSVTISVVDEPMSDDEVVPASERHEVYVEREVAELVDDQVLDAEIADNVQFMLLPQPTNGDRPG